ncbi:MAG: hypothetical protein WBD76_05385, partial [Methyloceanibacter sp.]
RLRVPPVFRDLGETLERRRPKCGSTRSRDRPAGFGFRRTAMNILAPMTSVTAVGFPPASLGA